MNSMLLPIHIAARGVAIVLGAVALSVKKGGTIHRWSGLNPQVNTRVGTFWLPATQPKL